MSSKLDELLSAVVDDEGSAFEARRLLDEVDRDEALRERWHRYHLIGAALRREGEAVGHRAALDRLWAGIDGRGDDAGAVPGTSHDARGRMRSRLTAAAIAATVALAVVVSFYPEGTPAPAAPLAAVSAPRLVADGAAPAAGRLDAVPPRAVAREADLRRTQAYMLRHAHHRALNQRAAGTVPFVKVAAFESR
jgi:sigma-E factor negative regulatory protein RseA